MSAASYATQVRSVAVSGVDAVLDGQLYISSLSCAKSIDHHSSFTHLVSVCPDLPRRNENHLIIPIQDTEYDNIIDHLPLACEFIDNALASGGCVLVHCVMGVSRSATVIAAYLMQKRNISPSEALAVIAQRRPQIFPNYGFVKQLHVFAACNYAPSATHPAYRSWKRRQRQDVTQFLNLCHDTTLIVPGLYLNSELPDDPDQLRCLARYTGLSHILTLSPSDINSGIPSVDSCHLDVPLNNRSDLVHALSAACDYIQKAFSYPDGRILVHSQTESIAALAACAFSNFQLYQRSGRVRDL
ncbi:phosphatases II [Peniophora sp. CONT]|nr:phosphatases II [Peniophora sp. CONT]